MCGAREVGKQPQERACGDGGGGGGRRIRLQSRGAGPALGRRRARRRRRTPWPPPRTATARSTELLEANSEWHKSEVKPGRKVSLFEPNLGEAFSRAVQVRMLGGGRKPLIQSFGTEPQTVVEHCLAATRIRKERDTRLTVVMAVFGLLFLPGTAAVAAGLPAPPHHRRREDKRAGALGTALLVALGGLAVLFLIKLPFTGLLGHLPARRGRRPGHRLVLGQADLRAHRQGPARPLGAACSSGGGVGAKIPEAVPSNPGETARRGSCARRWPSSPPSSSNSVFYAGPKGILGMGTRWGSWQLAEELVPADAGKEIHPFRSWDVIRAIHDQLRMLERGPLHTGGFPHALRSGTGSSPRSARAPRRSPGPSGTGRGRLPDQGPRDTADLQRAAVRRRRPALPGRAVRRSGTASW